MQLITILLGLVAATIVSGQNWTWVANITNFREAVEEVQQILISEDWATCDCHGDPHCKSFDGKWNDFQGKCLYTMARDNCQNGLPAGPPSWEVIINNEDANGGDGAFVPGWSKYSSVHDVKIRLHDRNMIIDIHQNGRVVVNGRQVLGSPYVPTAGVNIVKNDQSTSVTVVDGIKVSFRFEGSAERVGESGTDEVIVKIPGFMRGHVCGLCGNANNDMADDWMVGDSKQCMDNYPNAKPGDTLTYSEYNMVLFGTSWMADADVDDWSCMYDCPSQNDHTCDEINTRKANKHCHILQDMQGPFMECLARMSDEEREKVFSPCIFDACGLRNYKTVVCWHAAYLATHCRDYYWVNVCWRTANFCPMECGEGMEYRTCGNPCLPTCSDPTGANCGDIWRCEEGCFCKEDLVSDGEGKCIPQSQCGCQVPDQNVMIAVRTQFLQDNCEEICRCHAPQADLECEPYECAQNEVCGITRQGIRACICPKPYARDSKDGQCKDVCDLSKATGIGSRSVIRWYYNKNKGKCVEFIYSGQGGNENNFNSERDCKVVCIGPEEAEHCEQCCPGAEFLSCDVPEEDQCMDHADCDLGSVCCPTRCGRQDVCVTPVECCCPQLPFGPDNATTACRDDRDCEHRDEICCWGGMDFNYEMQCVAPIPCPCYPTQHDLCCPKSHRNQAKRDPTCQYCTSDIQCEPSMVCCVGADGCSYCVQGSINTCDSTADIEE